ncbi:receptor-type tyrosine-protein phosphatase N2, partial [Belonocnema kinseyi]|uniref:receptor-type tyrosine-protein phosphatase N2 n=1 Tax=Belonocnema kinseyi TaxID=2817044 RepID=UPI00143DAF0D
MGRKKWWRGGLELLVLCVLNRAILGYGEVGCLFSKNLCHAEIESCYNDLAFGRCIPLYTDEGIEDLYQYDLEVKELELLRLQLERLEADGYQWPHPYTQCIMQTSMYNLRYRLSNDLNFCRHLRLRKDSHFNEENAVDDGNGIRPRAHPKWSNKDPEETQNQDEYTENVPRDDFVNSLSDLSGIYTEGGIVLPLRHDDIAAEEIRSTLEETFRVNIIRAGIGDKAKLPATFEFRREMSSSMFGAVIAMATAAAAAAFIVIMAIARRQAKSRAKLSGLTAPDPEASKDYQELCRARMHAKQPTEKSGSPRVFPFISRVSESNNSPSNRSSTSSWGEEPALTNMDISTGHMVLSYMEDHLKNQDRLDDEWLGICAYEAEPCSTAVAKLELNAKLNRSGASIPYDHSRLILNDLANINNSDYINASTIKSTDHDPRNPAYIATQGPIQETASDFWQMVWEQGSVVIVMLTRLTEEGKGMCSRYWPGEGSELYHIYEVHLVSEHIWCDDYLVRSFYLKNLRTGETRTVTQFHFLSWPENGIPHSTKALLEFRRKVNKSYRGRSCPIVVHCSDGAGRTGTYCLIDMVLNRMAKGAKEIDIAATLEHIRDHRPGMVSTKQQFEFVLMAVAEEVHAILKALPIPPSEKPQAAITSSTPALSNS